MNRKPNEPKVTCECGHRRMDHRRQKGGACLVCSCGGWVFDNPHVKVA